MEPEGNRLRFIPESFVSTLDRLETPWEQSNSNKALPPWPMTLIKLMASVPVLESEPNHLDAL